MKNVVLGDYLLGSVFCLLLLSACSAGSVAARDYQTIADDPRRDTTEAERLNDESMRLIAEGELAEAERVLRRALAADVMFGPAHNNLGRVFYEQDRLYLAAWEFEYAAKLMPGRPEPRNNLGLVYEAAGKLDEAVAAYAQALDMRPEDPHLIGNLARARIRQGDYGDEVRALLEQLVVGDPRPEWRSWAQEWLALHRR